VAVAGNIGTLAALCTAFEAQYLFDPAQKWRYLSEFFKIKQLPGEKFEEYLNRIKEAGVKCRADAEQVCDATIAFFFPYIQGSVCNHDMELGQIGMLSIKKWAMLAETFQPAPVSIDTARLQQQIEELSSRLENTQMRVVNESRRSDQFDDDGYYENAEQRTEDQRGRTHTGEDGLNFSKGGSRQRSQSVGATPRSHLMTLSDRQSANQRTWYEYDDSAIDSTMSNRSNTIRNRTNRNSMISKSTMNKSTLNSMISHNNISNRKVGVTIILPGITMAVYTRIVAGTAEMIFAVNVVNARRTQLSVRIAASQVTTPLFV